MMKYVVLALALAAAASLPRIQPAEAAPKKVYKSKGPLKGVIYGKQRRIGGYSYSYSDVISPSKFRNSPVALGLQETGPIDGDFFFPQPRGPFGGYTPYMH